MAGKRPKKINNANDSQYKIHDIERDFVITEEEVPKAKLVFTIRLKQKSRIIPVSGSTESESEIAAVLKWELVAYWGLDHARPPFYASMEILPEAGTYYPERGPIIRLFANYLSINIVLLRGVLLNGPTISVKKIRNSSDTETIKKQLEENLVSLNVFRVQEMRHIPAIGEELDFANMFRPLEYAKTFDPKIDDAQNFRKDFIVQNVKNATRFYWRGGTGHTLEVSVDPFDEEAGYSYSFYWDIENPAMRPPFSPNPNLSLAPGYDESRKFDWKRKAAYHAAYTYNNILRLKMKGNVTLRVWAGTKGKETPIPRYQWDPARHGLNSVGLHSHPDVLRFFAISTVYGDFGQLSFGINHRPVNSFTKKDPTESQLEFDDVEWNEKKEQWVVSPEMSENEIIIENVDKAIYHKVATSVLIGSIPVIGDIADIGEFAHAVSTGKDFYGDKVTYGQLVIMGVAALLPIVPGAVRHLVK